MPRLDELAVLVVDCQTSGATPAQGDLLELGWAITTGTRTVLEPRASFTRTERPVSRIVRKLTGWDDAAQAAALDPQAVWARMRADLGARAPMPTVIDFARFELRFLQQLNGAGALPLDIVCLHAIAERLFPGLPRRNLRALAGHLGGAPEVLRRAGPHVAATALVWRAIVPRLVQLGVTTWQELVAWLEQPLARPRRIVREFPLPAARRRALPDVPGVYRFLRPNGDVLYVGKAASLKKRVASHFTTGTRATERALEMLSQAHEVEVTTTATALEAALLEVDEIKRLDPPYNVHLRIADRSAWFATRDWTHAASAVDDAHVVGPLPSERALAGIAAMRSLLDGAELDLAHAVAAIGVPPAFAPPLELFAEEWRAFAASELVGPAGRAILEASVRIVVEESPAEEDAPSAWDRATIRRYLERIVVGEGTLVRRARLLALLAHARVTFREPNTTSERVLAFAGGELTGAARARPPPRRERIAAFDASRYDRLRVLATELRRVATSGGAAEIRVGHHVLRW